MTHDTHPTTCIIGEGRSATGARIGSDQPQEDVASRPAVCDHGTPPADQRGAVQPATAGEEAQIKFTTCGPKEFLEFAERFKRGDIWVFAWDTGKTNAEYVIEWSAR